MINEVLKNLQKDIADWLTEKGITNPEVRLERSANPQFGEYSTNVAMRYAKELQQNPLEIAEELVSFLSEKDYNFLSRIEAVQPGFVNFSLADAAFFSHIRNLNDLGAKFGANNLHEGEKWVIEHSSPNPNKAMHLGHLRNNLIGMSLVKLLKFSGGEVKSDAIYNNRGISIAKNMYGYLAHMKKNDDQPTDVSYWFDHQDEWLKPEDRNLSPAKFITECYVLGEKDFTEVEGVEEIVRQMVIDWEANDEKIWALWQLVLQFAYDGA